MKKLITPLIIVFAVVIVVLTFLNAVFLIKYKKQVKENTIKQEQAEIISELKSILVEYGKETIENNDLTSNTMIRESLEMYEHKGRDVSKFNTNKIKCDKKETYFEVVVKGTTQSSNTFLVCEFVK